MRDEDVIAVGFSPGFVMDPTYWRVFIDNNCYLCQEVVITSFEHPEKNEVLRYTIRLSRAQFTAIWSIVERIGFGEFQRKYKSKMNPTDCATHWARIRLANNKEKEVSFYDLNRMLSLNEDPAAAGFFELWEEIHKYAPHGKIPIEEGRPKPWWKIW